MGVYRGGSKTKAVEEYIKEFRELGGFGEGFKFKRSDRVTGRDNYRTHWCVECPVCKYDKYSLAGLPFVFEESSSRLRKGFLSCRCSSSYQRSSEEYMLEVEELKDKYKPLAEIITSCSEKINARTKIKWKCEYNHINSAALNNLRKTNFSCNSCRLHDSRYKTEYEGRRCYLYLVEGYNKRGSFVKVGMTTKLRGRGGRLSDLALKNTTINVVDLYEGFYEDIFKAESLLHKQLHLKFGKLTGDNIPAKSTEYYDVYHKEGIQSHIKQFLKENSLISIYEEK